MECQKQKNGKYKLPKTVYNLTLWRIRDYHRIKTLADDLLNLTSPILNKTPSGGNISDTVAQRAIKRDKYLSEIQLIDEALKEIPQEYQKGIWNNIQSGQSYPFDASRATYGRYKSKFIYKVAEKLNLI